ncbi:hypothetical protein CVT26_005817 [Gymnopilus dilepis]|uniref:Uncharacterized protein n=1 Tax=Gymnopilus dilepis TaxID=231916 RepID=A0A409WFD4_9AGAR|nr:hypothetical protein CVT26_005817 [Gymnopilus dilepis]
MDASTRTPLSDPSPLLPPTPFPVHCIGVHRLQYPSSDAVEALNNAAGIQPTYHSTDPARQLLLHPKKNRSDGLSIIVAGMLSPPARIADNAYVRLGFLAAGGSSSWTPRRG